MSGERVPVPARLHHRAKPWKPRRRSVTPAAIHTRVPLRSSITAAESPACSQSDPRSEFLPRSAAHSLETQCGSRRSDADCFSQWQRHRPPRSANLTGTSFTPLLPRLQKTLLAVLMRHAKHLVGVHSMLARHSRHRSSRHQRRLDDPPLLLHRETLPPTASARTRCFQFHRFKDEAEQPNKPDGLTGRLQRVNEVLRSA